MIFYLICCARCNNLLDKKVISTVMFVHVQKHKIPVKIIRSRRYSLRMSYRKGSHAILNVPKSLSATELEKSLKSLEDWLHSLLLKDPNYFSAPPKKVGNGRIIRLMGESYHIRITVGDRNATFRTRRIDSELMIEVPPSYLGNDDILSRVFPKIVAKVFLKSITERVREVNAATLGVQYGKVAIRDVGSRWGSCTHENNIMLSSRLLLAPMHIIDHVILHELSHVIHKDHGAEFWALVASHDKNWKANDRWLNKNGEDLNY